MSIWSDYQDDYIFNSLYPFGMVCDVWRTREGKEIRVIDMTTSHIRSCMKIVGEDDGWYYAFERELVRRGEFEWAKR